jgi:hypothetical protein
LQLLSLKQQLLILQATCKLAAAAAAGTQLLQLQLKDCGVTL